jgi:signal-transduction protein with cAMP-binding, CBS, and nucleotidyltransferase domain
MPFITSPASSPFRFDEPVRNLLRPKGGVVWSISPDATVYQAIELMSDHKVGALIVLSGPNMAGIISERDYARKVILRGRSSHETLVRDIMTTPVLYVRPQQTVDECMQLMTSRRIRHLPVLEGDLVTGMLSIGDLVNWIVQSQDQTIHHLTDYIAGSYPA